MNAFTILTGPKRKHALQVVDMLASQQLHTIMIENKCSGFYNGVVIIRDGIEFEMNNINHYKEYTRLYGPIKNLP